jgi:hypothetical protein
MEIQANTSTSTEAAGTGSPMATVQIDGQKINVPVGIALDDEQLVRTLVVFFPDAANAQIEREHQADGNLIVKVTKRAGSKGSPGKMFPDQLIAQANLLAPVLEFLSKCEEHIAQANLLEPVFEFLASCEEQINPAILIDARIREAENSGLTLQEKLLLTEEVEEAINEGRDWKKLVDRSFDRLRLSQPLRADQVPTGF